MYSGNDDGVPFRSTNKTLSLDAALMYDSLLVLATAAKNLEYHMDSILFRNQDGNVSCGKEIPWMEGTTFFNYLNAVTVTGITGNISFEVSTIDFPYCKKSFTLLYLSLSAHFRLRIDYNFLVLVLFFNNVL